MALGGSSFSASTGPCSAVGSLATARWAQPALATSTVGSALFGVTGQRLATDLGSDANAIIPLVNRFANRDNPISGPSRHRFGHGHDQRPHRVQGNRATANVS